MTDETLRIVEVEWHDSEHVDIGWASADDYREALNDRTTYHSVGYLVESETDLMLVQSHSDRGMLADGLVIPRAVVLAVTDLAAIRSEAPDGEREG